MFYFVII